MKARIWLLLWLLQAVQARGQEPQAWERYLNEVMTQEDAGTAEWEETYELLCELQQHPTDLNRATREQLEQLPFLSAQQVEEIVEYRYHYGPMKSLAELQMIRSLDNDRRRLLACFVQIPDYPPEPEFPKLEQAVRYGRSELMLTGRIPCYERRGDKNGYQGYPYRHWLKYQFSYNDYVKAGIIGAQDAGEPFFGGKNRAGYDYYSFYLQLRRLRRLESLVAGKYRVALGMGMILNNSFGQGKLATLQSLGRPTNTIRPHSSRSAADYLQGAAATVSIGRGLAVTGFVSHRAQDATLNDDGTAATILTTGYHRTTTELEKKNNLRSTTLGGSLRYEANGLHAALNAVGTHLNRELKPNTTALYRHNYARGSDFLNASASYGYASHRLGVNGETAIDGHGALATLNSLSLQLGGQWSMMALQRFYSYRYTSLHARSFSDGGSVQNESGLYLGAAWQPSPRLKLSAYTDYAYFPWAKYQISQSSHSWDNLVQLTVSHQRWTVDARYRLRLRQRDNADKTALVQRTEHRARLSATYADGRHWSCRTQCDFGSVVSGDSERGLMVSQTLGYSCRWLRLNGGAGYFRTDSYDSRVYLYEPGPLYTYSFAQFSGQGIRYWLMLRANVGRSLMLTAKAGTTDYFDRPVIGSSYQQIDASSQTDIDLQLQWKF